MHVYITAIPVPYKMAVCGSCTPSGIGYGAMPSEGRGLFCPTAAGPSPNSKFQQHYII